MHRLLLVVAIACLTYLPALAAENLVENGGMEGLADENGAPPRWESQVIGTPPQLSVDATDKHSGQNSARIDAADITRSYFRSADFIPVAPGEELRGSAWVKVKDVP